MQKISELISQENYYKSSSFKLACLVTFLLGIIVFSFAYFSYSTNKSHLVDQAEHVLDIELFYFKHMSSIISEQKIKNYVEEKNNDPNFLYILKDKEGKLIAGNNFSLVYNMEYLKKDMKGFTLLIDGRQCRFAVKELHLDNGNILTVASNIDHILSRYYIVQYMSMASVIVIIILIIGGFLLSVSTFKKMNNIVQTVDNIVLTGDLSRRVKVNANINNDFNILIAHINSLLDKNEELIIGFRNIADNIAHDLRTPLTRIISRLEKLENSAFLSKDEIGKISEDCKSLLSTFNALLRIANIEKGKRKIVENKISMREIIEDVCELYEPLSEKKNIKFQRYYCPKDFFSTADRELVFQLYTNLMDNALKFSYKDSTIDIIITCHKKTWSVEFKDYGVGINEHEKNNIFEPFYRAEESRHTQGNGLGLGLVNAIVRIHHWHIDVVSHTKGTSFIVSGTY